jgi:hypothetical protein
MKTMKQMVLLLVAFCMGSLSLLQAQEVMEATVRVTVEPAATLAVNHKIISEGTSFQLTLPPDKPALLRLSAPGYKTEYRSLLPFAAERRYESFKLQRAEIPVLFRSNSPAKVLCDGQELGTTPFHYMFSEPKAYRIVFRSEGFDDHVVRLNLADGRPQVMDATLKADAATLVVESTPSGAAIQVNGVPRGVTPATFERLREGLHTVTLRMTGYHSFEQAIDLEAGKKITINPTLKRLSAALSLTSSPSSATVYVNGVQRGQTPLTVNDLAEGTYSIRFEKAGYEPVVHGTMVRAGETLSLKGELTLSTGEVKVQTQPSKVQVFLGGKCILTTSPESKDSFTSAEATLKLPIGEHALVFRADGYADAARKVIVKKFGNETVRVRLTFKPNFEVRTSNSAYRGVLIRKEADGTITLELRPGFYRTFTPTEIRSARIWEENNAASNR